MSEIRLVDIPWNKFVRFLVERDFEVIGGEENADRLYTDYLDAIMNLKLKNIIYYENNMTVKKLEIDATQVMIDSLLTVYDERIAELLREWYDCYELTIDTYKQDIECIVADCQMLIADYELYLSEKDKLIGKSDDTEQTVQQRYQFYADLIIEVYKMPNVGYIPDTVNTQMMCSLLKQLFSIYDKQKLNQNGKSRSD